MVGCKIPPVKSNGFTRHAYALTKYLKENGTVPVATLKMH